MNYLRTILLTIIIISILTITNTAQISKDDYKVFSYATTIESGKPLEKNILFKGGKNIIANVTLREGKALGNHTEKNAFWVITTAGNGELVLGENEEVIKLKPGVMVTVKPGIPHDVIAKPDLSILVVKFLNRSGKGNGMSKGKNIK